MNNYNWLTKRTLRKVDNLRLWAQNPRLNPENSYITTNDFAEEIISSTTDKDDFLDLAKSIARNSFIPADPIVVWQDEVNNRFYVAEGNRRVLAIKLLRNPLKAPRAIRNTFLKLSKEISKDDLEKIPVCIAPTFDDSEWYLFQRHNQSSLQRKWSREQQLRAIVDLYDKYEGNIEIIKDKTQLPETELEAHIRTLKIKNYVKTIKSHLSENEFNEAISHRFPISTLERWFSSTKVRQEWGVVFEKTNVRIESNEESFLNAFTHLIKRMVLPIGDAQRIDSRSIRNLDDIERVLTELPIVLKNQIPEEVDSQDEPPLNDTEEPLNSSEEPTEEPQEEPKPPKYIKNNPHRTRLILGCYHLNSDSYRLTDLFEELKEVPLKYKNAVAASIRVFLDLAILNHIKVESLEPQLKKAYKTELRNITLKQRIEYLKSNNNFNAKSKNILNKILNNENQLSLDVLNGYIHSDDSHFLNSIFLNNFWDFLFPLFEQILEITETN